MDHITQAQKSANFLRAGKLWVSRDTLSHDTLRDTMAHRKTPEEQIADLEKREAQIKARIQQVKAKERAEKRKRETRQKVIIGGMVKAHCERDPAFKAEIDRLLNEHVTRDYDRTALGLPALEKP